MLTPRQQEILRRVVEEYVATGQPVGSKTLADHGAVTAAASTVRGELAELEAKPGTRFTHAWGEELGRQADAMEDYFERVVATLTGAGYRWYETANFCRPDPDRDLRARHNMAYWLGRDYLGIGVGAVSTIEGTRRRNTPKLGRYLRGDYDREIELLDEDTRARERVMLGLRLDEPLLLRGLRSALDAQGLARAEQLGLAVDGGETLALTRRGRFLGGAVTAEIVA